jgi:hypothetical protein
MSQQHQQQIKDDDDHSTISAHEIDGLHRITRNDTNGNGNGNPLDLLSSSFSEGINNGDDLNELELKMAVLEVN